MVLAGQSLGLLLQGLKITVLGGEFFLQTTDLAKVTGLRKTSGVLAASLLVALEVFDLVLETEEVENHGVGTVEDQGQEEGETAEVHVALGVELPGLHFHTVRSKGGSSVEKMVVSEKNE